MGLEVLNPVADKVGGYPAEPSANRRMNTQPAFIKFRIEEVEQSIISRLEYIATTYPANIAIKDDNYTVTYTQLNTLANQVAQTILHRHATKPKPVALILQKGVPLIASMLGVLKSGMFFVLLDPSFPKQRLAAIVEDLQPESIIFDEQNRPLVQELAGGKCDLLPYESSSSPANVQDPRIYVAPDNIALIIYTSGSTASPKGVIQTHRSILHDMMLRTNTYSVCERDTITLLSSGTSSAINNTLLALLNGASLLPFNTHTQGTMGLAAWLSRERITVCWISSPLFRRFAATLTGEETFPDLRLIRLASDTVYKTDVDLYKKFFPKTCLLANGIAPTETGLLSTYFIDHQTEIIGDDVPLGYPVEDKEVLVVDESYNPVSFDQIGEIAVKSDYLAAGYWGNPNLTQERFMVDLSPFRRVMYLTGDLGQMRSDGALLYKGRKDFRLKVRGYGVETSEIEITLARYEGIRETVVLGRENDFGEAYIVAYFTIDVGKSPKASDLRAFLANNLPDYMIPSQFIEVDAFPLMPNGKIDRRALLSIYNTPSATAYGKEPGSSIEETLTKIWIDALGPDHIGINDNFFDLGGDSLKAIQIMTQLRGAFNIELPLSTLFEKSSISELAPIIVNAKVHKP